MPRKAAANPDAPEVVPRRSTRIKEQPKVTSPPPAPKKAPAKPRAKKVKDAVTGEIDELAGDVEEKVTKKPAAGRGKKRTAAEAEGDAAAAPEEKAAATTNGAADEDAEPVAKKVSLKLPFVVIDKRPMLIYAPPPFILVVSG